MSLNKIMKKWDATFDCHHIPMWLKKAVRIRYKKKNNVKSTGRCIVESELNTSFWDHYGSVERDGFRAMITQPYCDRAEEAKQWAEELDCDLVVAKKGGPWHENTYLYEFHPKQTA